MKSDKSQYYKSVKAIKPCEKISSLLNAKQRAEMMELLVAQNPNPKSALDFNNPFELICAVVLSAQATDISVNKVTPTLFKLAPDAKSMAALGSDNIAPIIQTIGLWRAKSVNLAKLSKIIAEEYDGIVPDDYDSLIKLPGVGSKTAKVVLNVAFHQPYIAVDTHIFRVCNRTGLCPGKDAHAVELGLPPIIEDRFKLDAHHQLLLHGRHVCKARTPECDKCCIKHLCNEYKLKNK